MTGSTKKGTGVAADTMVEDYDKSRERERERHALQELEP